MLIEITLELEYEGSHLPIATQTGSVHPARIADGADDRVVRDAKQHGRVFGARTPLSREELPTDIRFALLEPGGVWNGLSREPTRNGVLIPITGPSWLLQIGTISLWEAKKTALATIGATSALVMLTRR